MKDRDMDKQKWNNRYKESGFAFGTEPNDFLKEWLPQFAPATILFPAEGEGRNAVYASQLGWNVTAFDQSEEGKEKAMLLAEKNDVAINYLIDNCESLPFVENSFDAICFIYAHFNAEKKTEYHTQLNKYLKKNGIVIFEAFSKEHLGYRRQNPNVGGPTDLGDLYSEQEIKLYFEDFEIVYLKTEIINLSEGKYHNGQGSVIRFVGKKMR